MSDRNKAFELLEKLEDYRISAVSLRDFILFDYLSGSEALGAMQAALVEFGLEEDEDEEVDGSSWRESEDMFDENN
jgi:hypothetical protein